MLAGSRKAARTLSSSARALSLVSSALGALAAGAAGAALAAAAFFFAVRVRFQSDLSLEDLLCLSSHASNSARVG